MLSQNQVYQDISQLVRESTQGITDRRTDPFFYAIQPMVDELGGKRYIGPEDLEHAIVIEGDLPLIFTCPHGGYKNDSLPYQRREGLGLDKRAKEFTLALAYLMQKYFGRKPTVIINELDRQYVDLNRSPDAEKKNAPFVDERLQPYFDWYHDSIRRTLQQIIDEHGSGLHISWHTFKGRPSSQYQRKDLYQHKNGITETDKPEQVVSPLPMDTQTEVNFPVIIGTHLRTTIDVERGVDKILANAYWDFDLDGFPRGIPVFIPRETDVNSFLGGQYEITHALSFSGDGQHPIDGLQVEVRRETYMHSFEHLLFLSLIAMQKSLLQYGITL